MKTTLTLCCSMILAMAAGAASAQDAMKKDDTMMGKKEMTMKDCKDHMAMSKKDGMMKKDGAASGAMKK